LYIERLENLDITSKERWNVTMTSQAPQEELEDRRASYARLSVYTGIGVLAAGGLLMVSFILTGASGDVVFRSIITLALLTAFAFATLGENYASLTRAGWLTLVRIVLLLLTLGAGIWHVWAPIDLDGTSENFYVDSSEFFLRTFLFVLTVGVLQLAALGFSILDNRIRTKRVSKVFLGVLGAGISAFGVAMLMVALGFTFPHEFFELGTYWRIVTALGVTSAILIVITLMSRALNPTPKVAVGPQVQDHHPVTQAFSQIPQAYAPAEPFAQVPAAAQNTQLSPAGWYSTQDPSIERFWDGKNWTSYTRPAGLDDEQPPTVEGRNN
jgi:hypothetical protein